jgi:hypothetical protein
LFLWKALETVWAEIPRHGTGMKRLPCEFRTSGTIRAGFLCEAAPLAALTHKI